VNKALQELLLEEEGKEVREGVEDEERRRRKKVLQQRELSCTVVVLFTLK